MNANNILVMMMLIALFMMCLIIAYSPPPETFVKPRELVASFPLVASITIREEDSITYQMKKARESIDRLASEVAELKAELKQTPRPEMVPLYGEATVSYPIYRIPSSALNVPYMPSGPLYQAASWPNDQ